MRVSAAALKKARAKVSRSNEEVKEIFITFKDTTGNVEKYRCTDDGLVAMNSMTEEIEEHPGEFADLFQYQ